MSSVNNILYSVQNMAPALLGIGAGAAKSSNNYDALAALNTSLFGSNNANTNSLLNQLMGNNSSSSAGSDKVSLNYKSIGDRMVNDMAALTAETIKANPELEDDYVIALIDNGTTREARVYSRKEILDNFEGTASEKKSLERELATNPLMVFSNSAGLPPTDPGKGCQTLSDNLNQFLSKNNKNFNTLVKAGYDPLESMTADSSMKRILMDCAKPQDKVNNDDDDDDKASDDKKSEELERAEKLLKQLKEIINEAVDEEAALDDYVVAIVEEDGKREAKVYSRADVLNHFVGTEEEKAKLEKDLKDNPLMFFVNGSALEESAESGAHAELASALNDFLDAHEGELNNLDKEGVDPLADLLGSSSVKKALANYSEFVQLEKERDKERDKENTARSEKFVENLKAAIAEALGEDEALKDDYVMAIVENEDEREVKVYSRTEILENFEGTDEEKAALEKQLKENPLIFFQGTNALTTSRTEGSYGELASAIEGFLSENSDELSELKEAGLNFNPFFNFLKGADNVFGTLIRMKA